MDNKFIYRVDITIKIVAIVILDFFSIFYTQKGIYKSVKYNEFQKKYISSFFEEFVTLQHKKIFPLFLLNQNYKTHCFLFALDTVVVL